MSLNPVYSDTKLCDKLVDDNQKTNLFNAQQQQEEDIKKETEKQAFVGTKDSISVISAEYSKTESPEFLERARELESRFSSVRRVRGDGNCFYRAVAFAQLERIMENPQELTKFLELAGSWKERLLKIGFPEMTTQDFCDTFVDTVTDVLSLKSGKELEDLFNDQGRSDYVVVFMRLVTSGYMLENEEMFGGFIEGGKTVKEYCRDDVDPMYKECDHLCIYALTNGLQIPIRVEYCDRSLAPQGGFHHDFATSEGEEPLLKFLYRPGHYDILYK